MTVTSSTDIYNDGTYLRNNPDAHVSDSFFKFAQLLPLLDKIPTSEKDFSILDIGGGGGVVGHLVSLYFYHRNLNVRTTAVDKSTSMLEMQKTNNPFITNTIAADASAAFTGNARFDLTLAVDVFEHMPDYRPTLRAVGAGSKWLVCNMPIERNLFDFLRNLYMKGRYYPEQTRSIGHLHFFSYRQHVRELGQYFKVVSAVFSPYFRMITQVSSPSHKQQLQNKLRYAELVASRWISTLTPWAAPWIIQGSCYSLSMRKPAPNFD